MKCFRLFLNMTAAMTLLLILSPVRPALAESPYDGYAYDTLGRLVPSANGYLYESSIDGYDMPTGPFNSIEDLFVAQDDTLYVVDSGNNRIIRMDASKQVLGVYGDEEGEGKLNGPKGVYVTEDGTVYAADTLNERVAVFSKDGRFLRGFGRPESTLMGSNFKYAPAKIIVDKRQYMFVTSEGSYQGIVQLDPNGVFRGFYGANKVPFSLTKVIVKLIATKEQKVQLANVKPPEFSNVFQDQEGFIYTSSLGIRVDQIKRLSAVGVDTLNGSDPRRYGDFVMPIRDSKVLFEAFIDITVNSKGIITGLDQTTGRAFQYDKLGNLLFSFGGLGNQDGLFVTPSSIAETSDGKIYISDRTRNRIDRFRLSAFGQTVHEASSLYVDGYYDEALKPWQEVLKMDANYDMAYRAIGKALYKAEQFKEAMDAFYIAKDRWGHSEAFAEYRKGYVREHFAWFFIGATVFVALLYGAFSYYQKRRKLAMLPDGNSTGAGTMFIGDSKLNFPQMIRHLLFRPVDFFYDIQFHGRAKVSHALIIVAAAVVVRIFSLVYSGFAFKDPSSDHVSFLIQAALFIVPWFTWSVVNWAVSTLLDGEGKFIEIVVASAYALLPYVIVMVPLTLVSNWMTLNESSLYNFILWLSYIWVALLLLMQIRIVHDFELRKTIGIALLTLFGMLIVWLIGIMVYGLFKQFVLFVARLIKEFTFRM